MNPSLRLLRNIKLDYLSKRYNIPKFIFDKNNKQSTYRILKHPIIIKHSLPYDEKIKLMKFINKQDK